MGNSQSVGAIRLRAYRSSLSPEELAAMRLKAKVRWRSLSQEERQRRLGQHKVWLDSLSGAKLSKHKQHVSDYMKTRSRTRRRFLAVKRKLNYQERLKRAGQGLCKISLSCPDPAAGKTGFCLKHWLVYIAAAASKQRDGCRMLARVSCMDLLFLWNRQRGLCAISSHPLIPGDGASLDHIVPVARGGTNDISNLRFIYQTLNRIKADMRDDEFKAFLLKYWSPVIDWANKT